ncbi:MAG TPA: flavin reductase family protein [Burkholderiaceae bacterium]|jgi:flavin reductase (DIM6/NTAB) family NADH-FMN oxidoreductase RutF|nr:flavin reductase family protein [Burkholderiaceae bacterium]
MEAVASLFDRLTLGVYVVGAAHLERRDAFTAAWITQASYDPPMLAVSINPRNASYPLVVASGAFVVNVLKQGQLELARHFGTRSGREQDKLAGIDWRPGHKGAPVLEKALACFECELIQCVPAGDHQLAVARVVGGRILDPDAAPMSYAETGAMDGSAALYKASF